jgi:hypothetical protein
LSGQACYRAPYPSSTTLMWKPVDEAHVGADSGRLTLRPLTARILDFYTPDNLKCVNVAIHSTPLPATTDVTLLRSRWMRRSGETVDITTRRPRSGPVALSAFAGFRFHPTSPS